MIKRKLPNRDQLEQGSNLHILPLTPLEVEVKGTTEETHKSLVLIKIIISVNLN